MSTRLSTIETASGNLSWFQSLVRTNPGWGQVALRLGLAAVIWPHGAQKLLGWFGGYGFEGTMGFLTKSGIPAPVAFLVIVGEFFAPLLLVSGFLTRFAAASVAVIMAGAAFLVHMPNGFFVNWTGAQAGEGIEFHLLAIALALGLVIGGAGSGSIDLRLGRSKE